MAIGLIVSTAASSASALEPYDVLAHSVGPVQLRPQFSVKETYDSNVFLREEEVVDDFITAVEPGLTAFIGHPDGNYISLNYTLSRIQHLDQTILTRTDHRAGLIGTWEIGRVTIQGQDSVRASSGVVGRSLRTTTEIVDRILQNHDYTVAVELSPKTSFTLGGEYRDWNFESDSTLLDVASWRGTGGVRYHLSPELSLLSEAFYGQSYPEENQPTSRQSPDSEVVGGFFGAIGEFTPKFTGEARIGYEARDFEDETDGPSALVGELDLTYDLSDNTHFSLIYSRRTQQSAQSGRVSYESDEIDFQWQQEFGVAKRWSTTVGSTLEFRAYEGTTGRFSDRNDEFYSAYAELNYQIQLWLSTGFRYEFDNFATTLTRSQDYHVHRVSVNLSVGY